AHLVIPILQTNGTDASTIGAEIAGHWIPSPAWRFDGSFSRLHIDGSTSAAQQQAAVDLDGDAPAYQWQLHSTTAVRPTREVPTGWYYTGRLRDLDIDSYLRADVRGELRLSRRLSIAVTGQNLLTPSHVEFFSQKMLATRIPRSGSLELKWAY